MSYPSACQEVGYGQLQAASTIPRPPENVETAVNRLGSFTGELADISKRLSCLVERTIGTIPEVDGRLGDKAMPRPGLVGQLHNGCDQIANELNIIRSRLSRLESI